MGSRVPRSGYSPVSKREVAEIGSCSVGTAAGDAERRIAEPLDDSARLTQLENQIFATMAQSRCAVSIIVPVYNEEEILANEIAQLHKALREFPFSVEVLICENGSSDNSLTIARDLVHEQPSVRLVETGQRSYGAAIRKGIQEARADLVVIFNADLWCARFFRTAVLLLQEGYDIVIGSKCLVQNSDHRTWVRRLITRLFNRFLKVVFGFPGTDTHGMKAFHRERVLPVIQRCRTYREVFDTELVLKSQRSGLRICEIPVEVRDTRPARLSLLRRVPSTFRDLYVIWRTI